MSAASGGVDPAAGLTLPLRAPAPAKINLGLFIGPLTANGRHELVSVMQSISLADELTLELAGEGALKDEVDCPDVPGAPLENLAARALRGFRELTGWEAPPLRLSVRKRFPVAAGLGGGSADAAATLRLLASAAGFDASAPELLALAARLGSDVPAQVRPGRWLVSATGDGLEELAAPEPPPGILVVAVGAALSTAAVYSEADRLRTPRSSEELAVLRGRLARESAPSGGLPPAELLANDLEGAARGLCPEIDDAMRSVSRTGAERVLVSGSGPTVLGLFAGDHGPRRAERAADQLARAGGEGAVADAVSAPAAALPAGRAFGEPRPLAGP